MKKNPIALLILLHSNLLLFGQYKGFSDRHLIIQYADSTSELTLGSYHSDFEAIGAEFVKSCSCNNNLELWETSAINLETLRSTASEKSGVDTTDYDYLMINEDATDENFFRRHNVSLEPQFASTTYLDIQSQSEPKEIKVAVLDSGVDPDHPELSDRFWTGKQAPCIEGSQIGYDFKYDDLIPEDNENHGSGVNGVLLGNVHPKMVECSNGKFYAAGSGRLFDAICGIYLAIQQKVEIMNMSFGYESDTSSALLYQAVRDAAAADILMVTSAGNTKNNNNIVGKWPANFARKLPKHMIVVAAYHIENNDTLFPDYTSYGTTTVHLAAPGHVMTTNNTGASEEMYGTSVAAPHVTRTALMLLNQTPNLTASELKSCILGNVRKIEGFENKLMTGGILDPYKALQCQSTLPVVTSSFSGNTHSDGIQLNWQGFQDHTLEHYEIWRASDAKTWSWMADVAIKSDNRYSWKDRQPLFGNNYFKIRHLSADGKVTDSNILEFEYTGSEDELLIYPNPIGLNQILNIRLPQKRQIQEVTLFDLLGREQVLFRGDDQIERQGVEIKLSAVHAGSYYLRINTKGQSYGVNIVIN